MHRSKKTDLGIYILLFDKNGQTNNLPVQSFGLAGPATFLRNPSTASTDVAFTPRCLFAIATCHKAPLLPLHGNSDSLLLPPAITLSCCMKDSVFEIARFPCCHCTNDSVFEIANRYKAPLLPLRGNSDFFATCHVPRGSHIAIEQRIQFLKLTHAIMICCCHSTEILIPLPLLATMVYIIFVIVK